MDSTGLPERNQQNLRGLADLRGETVAETVEQITHNLLRTVPRSLGGYKLDYGRLDVTDGGVEGGLPWLRTAAGRTFYDHPGSAKDALMYVLLRDRLPRRVTADTFSVAAAIILRYLDGARGLPEGSTVAVDAGCYVGYKPTAFADAMGPDGRVVAIEMMPDNYELLERNVTENNLGDRIVTVNCALSNRAGTVPVRRKERQQATIADADAFDDRFVAAGELPMETLAAVLDRTLPNGTTIDYLNVQVNGAEVEALEGLGEWSKRVRFFHVASPYTVAGEPISDRVCQVLRELGAAEITASRTAVRAMGPAA